MRGIKIEKLTFLVVFVLIEISLALDIKRVLETKAEAVNLNGDDPTRDRRDVIEEEKFYNTHSDRPVDNNLPTPWLPQPLPPEEDQTTKISITNDVKEPLPLFQTTERVTDKPTGRGARASNENWIKLPFPTRDEIERDALLTPPQPSGELLNSRMPRINFVTQNKPLDTSETRHDKESIQRAARDDNIRTDIVSKEEGRQNFRPVRPRQATYYPDESRRPYYPDPRYRPYDDMYRADPYYDLYDRKRYYDAPRYGPRLERYDEIYDNNLPRKPKRIIYYAHLPEVVRTPPSVDLTQRWDPYRRPDDDYYARSGRYDYRFRSRNPYIPLRRDERNYRDLTGAGTATKDKKIDEKITATPILPDKQNKYNKKTDNVNRNNINSHQYHDSTNVRYDEPMAHKGYPDVSRPDDGFMRYEDPLFQRAVDDQYGKRL